MPIKSRAEIVARTRAAQPSGVVTPPSPNPIMGTWAVDMEVEDAKQMFGAAVNVMKGKGATDAEITATLVYGEGADTLVDVAACMRVLFDFTLRSIESLTGCKVHEPCLYIEPLVKGS